MSGFYEVTAAFVDGGGRQIPGRARNGQSDHESSHRRPHPHEGLGYHRPTTAALRPTGSAPRSSPGEPTNGPSDRRQATQSDHGLRGTQGGSLHPTEFTRELGRDQG